MFGRWRGSGKDNIVESRKALAGPVLGAILALVAFLLGFTFGMAGSQYNALRHLVIEHANAIGTTFLRAEQMPEPHRSKISLLLREYTKYRYDIDEDNFAEYMARSEQLQQQIWAEATEITQMERSPIVSIFIQSLNEMIDLHDKRLSVTLWTRLPSMLIIMLAFLTVLSMVFYGYWIGWAAQRQVFATALLIFAFATVFFLVIDLDRAHEGFFTVSQQSMIKLHEGMRE